MASIEEVIIGDVKEETEEKIVCEINKETCNIHGMARITRLTLLVGLPHN
jgi:hypothetical protein